MDPAKPIKHMTAEMVVSPSERSDSRDASDTCDVEAAVDDRGVERVVVARNLERPPGSVRV